MSQKKSYEELVEELKAEKAARTQAESTAEASRKKAEKLESAIKTAKNDGIVSLPVNGSYTAKWTTPAGKSMSQKVAFKDGRQTIILPAIESIGNMAGAYMGSESLLLIANGKDPKEEDLQRFPVIGSLDQEKAQAILTHFAGIKAGFLK